MGNLSYPKTLNPKPYISHKSCCLSWPAGSSMIFYRLCANVTPNWSTAPTRGGCSCIWTGLAYRGRAFAKPRPSIGLAMQTRTIPRTGQRWLSSWLLGTILVTLFDRNEVAVGAVAKQRRKLMVHDMSYTGRAWLLSPRLASTTWRFSPWPIAPAQQECASGVSLSLDLLCKSSHVTSMVVDTIFTY